LIRRFAMASSQLAQAVVLPKNCFWIMQEHGEAATALELLCAARPRSLSDSCLQVLHSQCSADAADESSCTASTTDQESTDWSSWAESSEDEALLSSPVPQAPPGVWTQPVVSAVAVAVAAATDCSQQSVAEVSSKRKRRRGCRGGRTRHLCEEGKDDQEENAEPSSANVDVPADPEC